MAPFIRIALRYIVGILLAHGYISDSEYDIILHDHDLVLSIEIIVGLLIASLTEIGYLLAKKWGWRT